MTTSTQAVGRLIPSADNVLVSRAEKETVSAGGIALAHRRNDVRNEGVVVGVGPRNTEVSIGDRILFDEELVQSVWHQGTEYIRVAGKNVLAVFDEQRGRMITLNFGEKTIGTHIPAGASAQEAARRLRVFADLIEHETAEVAA